MEAKLKWIKPDAEALRTFLIEEKQFQESKVASGLTKLQNCAGKANQCRLDLFFKSAGTKPSITPAPKKGKGVAATPGAASGFAKRGSASMGGRGRGRRKC